MLESRMIQVGPVQLQVFEDGPADATHTAVLQHGTTSSARIWAEVQRQLAARGIRSFAVNMRGAGGSDHTEPPEDYKPSNYAKDLAEALRVLGVQQFTMVAHALGTRIAARYLMEQDQGQAQAFAFMSGAHMLQAAPARLDGGRPAAEGEQKSEAERYAEWRETHYGLPEEDARMLWADIAGNRPQRARGQQMEEQPDHVPLLATLPIPILCMTGDQDGPRVEITLRAYLGLRPEQRHLQVFHGDVSHYPPAQIPAEVAEVLARFMRNYAPMPAERKPLAH